MERLEGTKRLPSVLVRAGWKGRGAGLPDGRPEGGRCAVTRRRAAGCGVRAT
jgi:hypothetical protein